MAGHGRNDVCGCGSGKKAKRCCGVTRGPGPDELAKVFLAEQARSAAVELLGITRVEFDELFEEMLDLPRRDVSLHLHLPRLLSPELEQLRDAIGGDDDGAVDRLLPPAMAQVDSPRRRADLAHAVQAFGENGRSQPQVVAVALIDLTTDESALVQSSLLEALAVSAGAARTPAGLLVAAR